MFDVSSVKELQELNPYIIIGCGGGGEKFSNLEGIETVAFIDDDPEKQGKKFCSYNVGKSLEEVIKETNAKSIAIMLPIGAEGAAIKYAVQAIDNGKNVVCSFRSLPLRENKSLLYFAKQKSVVLKEISPRLDVIKDTFGVAPESCCEILPKISYKAKAPVVFIGGTSQECGKRTTTRLLGKAAEAKGINFAVISTDEMGIEEPSDINFRAGSLSVMDVPAAIKGIIKRIEEEKSPDIIFIESQSSLTELGNPHPRGLSASILIGAAPDVSIVCHRPNHPYREPKGINYEIKAIESLEPTKVVGLSLNLKNADENVKSSDYENKYGLPASDVYYESASKLLDVILEYLDKKIE
ncbi:MAG: DUF1611 domain-containing protein [Methanobacteriaceae archaeon]